MRIEHIALWCADIELLKGFYMKYFGAQPGTRYVNSQKSFQSYFLSFDDGSRLELMQMPGIPENENDPVKQYLGLIHFAVSVGSEQNVIDMTKRFRADGYEVVSEPRKTGDGYFESCILDPEGNRIEITV
ncbi:MAG: VOC family protein [Sediminispirochaetaceae bacterium]